VHWPGVIQTCDHLKVFLIFLIIHENVCRPIFPIETIVSETAFLLFGQCDLT